MKLRLGACLKTDIEFLTMTHNLLNYLPHLIYLDGIDNEIFGLVAILIRSQAEAS